MSATVRPSVQPVPPMPADTTERRRTVLAPVLTLGGIMAFELVAMLASRHFGSATSTRVVPAGYSNTRELGRVLYTQYVYAFEIAAVILLVAIIAAIALTLRRRKDTKALDPALQLAARRAERVRLVSMPAETER